ncbi:hypothetical protein FFJ24_008000 [Pedobacter sp. KBS0701]|uniref:abortive infection family protein n=1 Tax=Pedobacter sp. KBS0701 TaxID=2578106 RepID=UPI00110EB01A|nr:abortive infection family protein [Pedobacter sp. KBS0701]QDW24761.1 hypothetical protein FFJ24_008000 [Pedobacter sp. KBS0701]
MAEISFLEMRVVTSFLEMGGGYVLNFSDRTFQEFVGDAVGMDILSDKYAGGTSGSKGNRLKQFMKLEDDYTVGKLFTRLHQYKLIIENEQNKVVDQSFYNEFYKISERLLSGKIIEHIDAIQATNDDKDFHQLAKLIKESIENNEPESALDRLHTFLFKFLKELCKSHNVEYSNEESINAIYGKYIKAIRSKGLIESEMAEKIIQSTFQVMQAFNDIRNNRSFAHDNPVLNYDESVFIFSNVTATVKYIQTLETKHKNAVIEEAKPDWSSNF